VSLTPVEAEMADLVGRLSREMPVVLFSVKRLTVPGSKVDDLQGMAAIRAGHRCGQDLTGHCESGVFECRGCTPGRHQPNVRVCRGILCVRHIEYRLRPASPALRVVAVASAAKPHPPALMYCKCGW
jgi:hypothetical protein